MVGRNLKVLAGVAVLMVAVPFLAAEEYNVDPAHSSVTFQISHMGLSWVHGRFNTYSGTFTIESSDPAKSSFAFEIKPESVDTANSKRDEHLKSPDFFNVKQFPVVSFKSTSVKAAAKGFEVTGDLSFHGVVKPVTFTLEGGRTAEFPKGVQRTGYSAMFTVKRSDFGMGKMTDAIGDDVYVAISFEGVKK